MMSQSCFCVWSSLGGFKSKILWQMVAPGIEDSLPLGFNLELSKSLEDKTLT